MQTSAEMEKSDDYSENADWILESFVAYLPGPVWVTPILNFLEEKSVGTVLRTCIKKIVWYIDFTYPKIFPSEHRESSDDRKKT